MSMRRLLPNYRLVTKAPRVAGTEADRMQAKMYEQMWADQGLDQSGIEGYDVLLSYPGNSTAENKVGHIKV